MAKSVGQRVLDSFQGAGAEIQAKEYSQNVYAAWKDISASLSRSALLIFLLMAVFELLVNQHTSTAISIGSFMLVNAPIVQIALPTIVAFVIYDSFRLSVRWLRLGRAYIELTKIYAPVQRDNGLDFLIEPNLPSLWGIGAIGFGGTERTADRFMSTVNAVVRYAMMLAVPVAFESQAYYRLIQKFGYDNIFLWVNAGITILLGVCTVVYVWLESYGK